jgi:hypothetical protein
LYPGTSIIRKKTGVKELLKQTDHEHRDPSADRPSSPPQHDAPSGFRHRGSLIGLRRDHSIFS